MKRYIVLLFAAISLIACQKPGPEPEEKPEAPKLVSTSPSDGATELTGESLVLKLTFDQNVKCVSSSSITAGDAKVDKVFAYDKDVSITLSSLEAGKSYTVTIPEGCISGFRNNPAGKISISFSMKEREAAPVHYEFNPGTDLCNASASSQAKKVYEFLLQQSGKKTLSGVMSGSSNSNDFADLIYSKTGKYPALTGYDFIFLPYSPTPESWSWKVNYNDISAAREQWNNNGLVSYMWHWSVPTSESAWKNGTEKGDYTGYAFYSDKTAFDIKEALKEGTWQNQFLMKDIEEAASYLKNLRDAGIPVIWRPLHEAAGNYNLYSDNGAWFWWGKGGAEPCKQLWRLLYDQFTKVHGLNNLIWVWTVDATAGCEDQYDDWYPGDDVVDIVGVDIYENNTDAKTRQFQALVDVTKGKKLVTVSECGNIPDPDKCFAEGNAWSWFMVWCTYDENNNLALSNKDWYFNTQAWWKNVMGRSKVLNRDNMPDLK